MVSLSNLWLILVVTDLVVLAVHRACSQEVERFHPASSVIFAFLFHPDESGFRMAFLVVWHQRDVVPLQGVSSVARICLCRAQDFRAGNPVVLLSGGGPAIAAVGGKGELVSSGGSGRRPDASDLLAHCRTLIYRSPILEAQTIEKPGPHIACQFPKASADQRVLGE